MKRASFLGLLITSIVVLSLSTTAEEPNTKYGTFDPTAIVIQSIPDRPYEYNLLTTLNFDDVRQSLVWAAPEGMVFDGASIPSFLWDRVGSPFTGRYVLAAAVHDHYCAVRTREPKATHRAFYNGMRANGVSKAKAKMMYFGVKTFGPYWEAPKVTDETPPLIAGPTYEGAYAETQNQIDMLLSELEYSEGDTFLSWRTGDENAEASLENLEREADFFRQQAIDQME